MRLLPIKSFSIGIILLSSQLLYAQNWKLSNDNEMECRNSFWRQHFEIIIRKDQTGNIYGLNFEYGSNEKYDKIILEESSQKNDDGIIIKTYKSFSPDHEIIIRNDRNHEGVYKGAFYPGQQDYEIRLSCFLRAR